MILKRHTTLSFTLVVVPCTCIELRAEYRLDALDELPVIGGTKEDVLKEGGSYLVSI
jgi:hypothetical protein